MMHTFPKEVQNSPISPYIPKSQEYLEQELSEEERNNTSNHSIGADQEYSSGENTDDINSDDYTVKEPDYTHPNITWTEVRKVMDADITNFGCALYDDEYEPIHYKEGKIIGDNFWTNRNLQIIPGFKSGPFYSRGRAINGEQKPINMKNWLYHEGIDAWIELSEEGINENFEELMLKNHRKIPLLLPQQW